MPQPDLLNDTPRLARIRAALPERVSGVVLALVVEALMVLVLLTLGRSVTPPEKRTAAMVSIAIHPGEAKKEASKAPKHARKTTQRPAPAARRKQQPQPQPPAAAPSPPPPAFIDMSNRQMAAFDISRLSRGAAPAKPSRMGPADGDAQPDSVVVGTAPGGEPLYAASWYREPYDDELRGYLSTASGPGWGLIACKTAPEYRVVDCVPLDEYPQGSRIANAVLAAAWQFKVRPPRVGGVPQIGDWVRIRIDYGIKYRKGPAG